MTVDRFAGEGVDHDAGLRGREGHQERARRDRAEGIEPERVADRPALRQHHDAIAVDAKPHARGIGQLDERGGDPALGRIVHRVHRGQLAGDLDLRQDAESGTLEKALRPADGRRGHAALPQLGFLFARDDRRTLEGDALGHHDRIADLGAGGGHELVLLDFAEHRAGDDRSVETVRDLGVSSDEYHLELLARRVQVGEERLDRGLAGGAGGQQQGRQEPPRARAANRDVVGVDVERVPPDLGGRERDGIARRDEVPVAHVDDGGIFTDLGTDDDAGILGVMLVEDRLQRVGTELADWQGLHAGG